MVWVSWLSLTVDTTEMETFPFELQSCPLSILPHGWALLPIPQQSWGVQCNSESLQELRAESGTAACPESQLLLDKSKRFEVTFLLFSFSTQTSQLVRKFVAMLLPSEDSYSPCVLCDLSGRSVWGCPSSGALGQEL